jgi:hypothetical protein
VFELFADAGIEAITKDDYAIITTARNPIKTTQDLLKGTLRVPQGDLKETSEVDLSPKPAPTPTPAPTPNVLKETTTTKGDEGQKPAGNQPSPRAVIGRMYCEAFEKVTVPSSIWPEIDRLIEEYSFPKVKDAFTTFMGSRGKTMKYLIGILNENGGEKQKNGENNDQPGRFGEEEGQGNYRIDVG